MKRLLIPLALVALCAFACGSDDGDDGDSEATTTTTTEAPAESEPEPESGGGDDAEGDGDVLFDGGGVFDDLDADEAVALDEAREDYLTECAAAGYRDEECVVGWNCVSEELVAAEATGGELADAVAKCGI